MLSKQLLCSVCHGKGRLRVKRNGFSRRYFIKCHDCKGQTILTYSPEKALGEWNGGWIFGSRT